MSTDKSMSVSNMISSMMAKHRKNSPKKGVNLIAITQKLFNKKKSKSKVDGEVPMS